MNTLLPVTLAALLVLGATISTRADGQETESAKAKAEIEKLRQEVQRQRQELEQLQQDFKRPLANQIVKPSDAAKQARVEQDIANIITQLELYKVIAGTIPSTAQGLKALIERPAGEPQPQRWRQLMPEQPKDPWGNPYGYRMPATRSKIAFDLFSAGPDGKFGTEDDIGNW